MNVKLLREMFDDFKESAAAGLMSSDIWSVGTAQSIIGHNSQPAATALFNRMSGYLNKSLANAGFPPVNRYYMIDLADDKAAVVAYLSDEYLWGILVDTKQIQIGLLLHVILPEALGKFQQALNGSAGSLRNAATS